VLQRTTTEHGWTRDGLRVRRSSQRPEAFGQASRFVGRAGVPLGDVTLMAILDRVLHNAAERFPLLSPLEMDETGVRSDKLRERVDSLPRDQLQEGIRFILTEFLTVLGNLTAEVLTPALHSELSKIASGAAVPGEATK
jgi:hypothetical protein